MTKALVKYDKNAAYGINVYKTIFIYFPAFLVTVIYFLSLVYIISFRSAFNIPYSLQITLLDIAQASIYIGVYYWTRILVLIIIPVALIIFYKLVPTVQGKKYLASMRPWIKVIASVATCLCIVFSPLLIVQVDKIAKEHVKKVKQNISNEDELSTITFNDEIVGKGIIVAMSDSMVWIYNGKETVAMKIGNHKIKTPIAK